MKTTFYAALVALPFLLAATGESFAWNKNFAGTRDQVRTACAAVGGELREDASSTGCTNKNGTIVVCTDDGGCAGSGSGPAPARIRIAMLDLGTILGTKAKAEPKTWQPPESLTAGSSDGVVSGAPTGNTGWDSGDIGQWHTGGESPIFHAN